jgi:hypothetical protein
LGKLGDAEAVDPRRLAEGHRKMGESLR